MNSTRTGPPLRRRIVLCVGVLAGAALGACGKDDGGGPPAAMATIDVAILPIADLAPLYLGKTRGFFADEGIDVRPHVSQAGAIVASVVSGEFQFGWLNTTSLITARSKGLPVRVLRRFVRGGSTPEESSADILVRTDGPIGSPKDLEGRTIGVVALKGVSTLTANAALEKQGVDIAKIKYLEVPFPEAVAALESGRVDAAYVAEPFATLGLKAEHRSISRPILETAPDFIVAGYFTTEKYVTGQRELVDRFERAVNRSFDYASTHLDEVRAVLPTYTGIPAGVALQVRLPDFSASSDTTTLDLTASLARKYGYIEKAPDISELLYGD
ncbi:MAG: ABC transporter substrate-binding protein [Acidimicrobiales bacterium]